MPPLYNYFNGSFLTKIFVGLGTAKTQLSQLEETVASATVHKSLSDFKLTVFPANLFVKLVRFGLFRLDVLAGNLALYSSGVVGSTNFQQ